MNNWKEDKKWSDKFLPEIKRILGENLIKEPPNTDLIVLKLESIRIACRIRKFNYFEKFRNEFTIRAGRPSNKKVELTKIIEGWGDYLFYGFSNKEETGLIYWKIIDLNKFRLYFNRFLVKNNGYLPGKKQQNFDNSSYFYIFTDKPELIYNQYKLPINNEMR